ncbi:helix-turn-helix domain-containing protein [Deinococcus planocerae]|uniref:helix-turn-helix domain-containing protein n=1 Tax=Deinococcus planocerae TaxID=1737569 RepID=UPI000C7ECD0A|nr:helix-turn-helix domain-containing protein [Deinococcus planocerae]
MRHSDWSGLHLTLPSPRVVCLCGAERFRAAFAALDRRLTDQGCVVVTIANPARACDGQDPAELPHARADLHKIEWCDEFVVLNVHGYIDELTRQHLRHAQRLGKRVRFVDPLGGQRRPERPDLPGQDAPRRAASPVFTPAEGITVVGEGTVMDLTAPFKVRGGAVLLYGPDETRPACTLVSEHVWPGVQWVPEVWYAEAASHTQVVRYSAEPAALQPIGELIRWAIATSGQIWERMLWGLLLVDSVATQEELSAIIGCRRESVTTAMRDFRARELIEKVDGRIRLTAKGLVYAAQLGALEGADAGADLGEAELGSLAALVDPDLN